LLEYACHEGNHSFSDILAGTRRQELDGQTVQDNVEVERYAENEVLPQSRRRIANRFLFSNFERQRAIYLYIEGYMSKGTVKWFNADKGFGFITPAEGGNDLFVHYSEIKSDGGFATLNDGQEVEYEVGQGQKGPCANKVVPL
jgi:CspA family cold shock protein